MDTLSSSHSRLSLYFKLRNAFWKHPWSQDIFDSFSIVCIVKVLPKKTERKQNDADPRAQQTMEIEL